MINNPDNYMPKKKNKQSEDYNLKELFDKNKRRLSKKPLIYDNVHYRRMIYDKDTGEYVSEYLSKVFDPLDESEDTKYITEEEIDKLEMMKKEKMI